ncbi:DUF4142 domain-containing protein [Streptomyces sp. NA02950]|uniref:DUF4142 domain-containing protein n=1 Tax=Streptomyces sp. NA02950 TaxID=2742137 RepID=UPI0020CB5575|nr:DUF4142 domain-containing protein [Streptomyces sp. NA02950]
MSRVLAAVVALVAIVAGVAVWMSQSDGADEGDSVAGHLPSAQNAGAAAAGSGGLTELDKTFLVKVRQAGLWEIPAGRMAQSQASSEAIKRAGMHLLDGHSKLDQLTREDAKALNVPLPDEASAEQQGWVDQMKAAKGREFDQTFVDLLRASHGKIFITIGQVRATTKNAMIRRLATQANNTVNDHMEVLEDTGLVTDAVLDDVASTVPKSK